MHTYLGCPYSFHANAIALEIIDKELLHMIWEKHNKKINKHTLDIHYKSELVMDASIVYRLLTSSL